MKKCNCCDVVKGLDEYHKKYDTNDGRCSFCKQCVKNLRNNDDYRKKKNTRSKLWNIKNKERLNHERRENRKNIILNILINSRKNVAKQRNLDFDIESQDISLPIVCPVLNIPIIVGDKNGLNNPSIDRIDNSKGYTKDNIVVVSNKANKIKSDASLDELWLIYWKYKQLSVGGQDWYEI